MSFPACRPDDSTAKAIFIDEQQRLRTERIYVLGSDWVARRNGRLVPLDSIRPEPVALQMQDGRVADGDWRRWRSLDAFARDQAVNPAAT